MPDHLEVETGTDGGIRYRFKVSGKEDLNRALAEAVSVTDPELVNSTLLQLFDNRFTDAGLAEAAEAGRDWVETHVVWRRLSPRPCRVEHRRKHHFRKAGGRGRTYRLGGDR